MPITKSAKKSLRKNLKRRVRNLFYKNKIRNLIKKIKILVKEKNLEEAEKNIPHFYKAVDKAVKEKVIKKNTGARKKSQIINLINRAKNLNLGNEELK